MLSSKNPIAQQSQKWIIQALLDLMEQKEYDNISVSEICRKAELGRRTFYRNFSSKNEVLEHLIHLLCEEYMNRFATLNSPTSFTAAKVFFEFWSEHLSFIRNIIKCGLSDFIFQEFERFTKEHTELLIGDEIEKQTIEYVYAYRIGGFWNTMLTWAMKSEGLPPDEMAKIVSQIR